MRDVNKAFQFNSSPESANQEVIGEVTESFQAIAESITKVVPTGYLQTMLLGRLWEVSALTHTVIANGEANMVDFGSGIQAA
jgi:hypothetical protein